MRTKPKYRNNKNNKTNRLTIRQCTYYDPDFKKAVVLYAEEKSTSEAKKRYGISESNIRRWRRLKAAMLEKASQSQAITEKPPESIIESTQPIVKTKTRNTRKSKRTTRSNYTEASEEFDDVDHSSSLDSMPLEQRLIQAPVEQPPVLQSQPLSPTKLKVTRQTARPAHVSPKPPSPPPPNEEVCLRWNSHHANMQASFPSLLMREQYVDATLVADGQTLKCHRLILSSCSSYFEDILSGISPYQHPVLFMKDIPFWVLKCLCDFMYAGEVHIYQNKLEELLAIAETLKIKGLAGKPDGANEDSKTTEPVRQIKEEKEKKEEKKMEKEVLVREKKRHIYQPSPQKAETPPPISKPQKITRSSHVTKKIVEKVHREPLKGGILDPLDLLEPVYEEELTKEIKQATVKPKFKEAKEAPVKKAMPKKLKKRKLSDDREESPPPLFQSRKGTRSRPHVKIPKYYHFDRVAKNVEFPESTIVREPHTDVADPLMQVEQIKAEPLDLEDDVDVIEIEDNAISFSDQEMPLLEQEMMGNYDSPSTQEPESKKGNSKKVPFKKINLMKQPVIMDVHSISEDPQDTLKIIDVSKITGSKDSADPLATEDPLSIVHNSENITITEIQSMPESSDTQNITIASVQSLGEAGAPNITIASVQSITESESNESQAITITNVQSVTEDELGKLQGKDVLENNSSELGFHIAEVISANVEESEVLKNLEYHEAEFCESNQVELRLQNVTESAKTEESRLKGEEDEDIKAVNDSGTHICDERKNFNQEDCNKGLDFAEDNLVTEEVEENINSKEVSSLVVEENVETEKTRDNKDNNVIEDWSNDLTSFQEENLGTECDQIKEIEGSGNNEESSKNLDLHSTQVRLSENPNNEKSSSEICLTKSMPGDEEDSFKENSITSAAEESAEAEPHLASEFVTNKHESGEREVSPGYSQPETEEKTAVEEDCPSELGFHIAKVAREQFDMNDCDKILTSTTLDEAENTRGSSTNELDSLVNDLSEMVVESHVGEERHSNINNRTRLEALSEETICMAQSLEELLEK